MRKEVLEGQRDPSGWSTCIGRVRFRAANLDLPRERQDAGFDTGVLGVFVGNDRKNE